MKAIKTIQAFFTGSRVYGTPKPDSDLDMVLRIDYPDLNLILNSGICDAVNIFPFDGSVGIRIGKLNLICVHNDRSYGKWFKGTQGCAEKAPVTKEESITFFENLGIPRSMNSAAEDEPTVPTKTETQPDDTFPF